MRLEFMPDGSSQCHVSEDLGYVLYSSFGSFFVPLILMIVVYR
jgi:hypothetical protein